MKQHFDIAVVGGGAIGATIAWRLGQAGHDVILLERGRLGGESSSAAAGMLGAQLEVDEPGEFYHLCVESRTLYREFADDLLEETGVDIQLTHNGILHLAADEDEVSRLQRRRDWQIAEGSHAHWWTADAIATQEEVLSAPHGALFLPDDSNVSAPMVTRALAIAAARRSTVVEGADVSAIHPYSTHVEIQTPERTYEVDHVVVAAGAWADRLLSPTGATFGIKPVKGQLFALRPARGKRLVHTVFSNHVYLVPKRDGTVVVGATEEHDTGYQRDVTLQGLGQLMAAATQIAPGLRDAEFVRAWVGLRPRSYNGLPFIGPLASESRVHVAVGHFRNGILLTPVTAAMVTHGLSGSELPDKWRAFLPKPSSQKEEI